MTPPQTNDETVTVLRKDWEKMRTALRALLSYPDEYVSELAERALDLGAKSLNYFERLRRMATDADQDD